MAASITIRFGKGGRPNERFPVIAADPAALFQTKGTALLAGIATATVTVLAGIALLGLSGWFITATAIAGLSIATAVVFDVFAPAAGIRLLAILRTGSRYLERLVTHDATLAILAALREKLFRSWARPTAANTLLKRPARLLFRLTADIDALDSLYLRVLVPVGAALATALVAGIALGLMSLLFGLLIALVLLVAGLGLPLAAARRSEKPMRQRAKVRKRYALVPSILLPVKPSFLWRGGSKTRSWP